jgi:hypothetical protein
MVIVSYQNLDFAPEIRYVFDLFFSILGIDHCYLDSDVSISPDDMCVFYGTDISHVADLPCPVVRITESSFFTHFMTPASMPCLPLQIYEGVPMLYEQNDIIAGSFFMLTCYEEFFNKNRDAHNRFPAKESVAYRADFLERPIVNEYIKLFYSWLVQKKPNLKRSAPSWNGKPYAVCLTHDIDYFRGASWKKDIRRAASILKHQRDFKKSFRHVRNIGPARKDLSAEFKDIVQHEKTYGFRSSFYFLADTTSSDTRYDVTAPRVQRALSMLRDENIEIGLHGSYASYSDYGLLQKEFDRIRDFTGSSSGGRQHYLRFDYQKTFALYEKIGMRYDTTLGFASAPGFRCGICHPFYPYNISERRPFDILEIPLILMDATLHTYLQLDIDSAFERVRTLFSALQKYGGCCSMLWHNEYLDDVLHPDYAQLYWRILAYLQDQNATGISGQHTYTLCTTV